MKQQETRDELLTAMLTAWMRDAFRSAYELEDHDLDAVCVVVATDANFGDYQCNGAMKLARVLKMAPIKIAEGVASAAVLPHCLARAEVAPPGFINLHLDNAWLARRLETVSADERLGVPDVGQGAAVVMDYGSPNITKPLHIGHLRSHNIGGALDRLYRFIGYRVIADNHLGDWGTQFGITIKGYREFGDEAAMTERPLEELERVYVQSFQRAESDPEWMDACRAELVKLQGGDQENRRLWQMFVDLSVEELNRVYARLGVSYDLVRGESHYQDQLAGTVKALEDKGLARPSEGATVVFLEEEGLPVCIVRKRDGGFNYATTDLATVASRVEEFKPDRIVYVTDERQQTHFKQIFAICRRLGETTRLDHVWFGLMRLPEGVIKTREGNVIKLERLLDEAEKRTLSIVEESSPDMVPERQREIARSVGIGAVKYADLSQNPQSLVTFTWEKALALDGNSGPYLQYAHARIASVREKYTERFGDVDLAAYPLQLNEPIERLLALKLIHFPEVVLRAAERYKPNVVADALYDICQTYSSFYQNVPFLKAEEGVRESRVRLCGMVAAVLGKGLELLGLEAPDRI